MVQRSSLAPAKRVAVIVALVLLGSCAAIDLLGLRTPSAAARAETLEQAQRRWAARSLAHYRVVLQAPSWCRMDLEVQAERVVRVYQNSCPGAPLTISELFAIVQRLDSQAGTTYCAPSGCECIEQRFATTLYDEQLGFPQAIGLRRQRANNWAELPSYFLAHGLPHCLTPLDTNVVSVLSLQPLS